MLCLIAIYPPFEKEEVCSNFEIFEDLFDGFGFDEEAVCVNNKYDTA